ncbi:hypothetical protein Emag_001885 [Eimeria magna]
MEKSTESELFITFPSERDLMKYQATAAAASKRPVYAALVCRAARPGQLDVTIRMHVRRGTPRSFANDTIKNRIRFYSAYDSMTYFGGSPYLLEADVIGTPAEGAAYGHLTGGFLDLLTLAHAFNLDRTGVRKIPADPIELQAASSNLMWNVFYSRTKHMGVGMVMAALVPLHNILRVFSAPMRRAYSPVDFMETAMPHVPATTISRSSKPNSCSAPFVVLLVCILWQVVKAIMVDKETGFKVGNSSNQVQNKTGGCHFSFLLFQDIRDCRYIRHMRLCHQLCCVVLIEDNLLFAWPRLLQNMLKIMGVPDRILWLSWYLFFIIFNFPLILILALVASYLVFTLTSFWLVLLLFSLAVLASISFAVFVTALFKDGNLAGRQGGARTRSKCLALDIAWLLNEPFLGGVTKQNFKWAQFEVLAVCLASTEPPQLPSEAFDSPHLEALRIHFYSWLPSSPVRAGAALDVADVADALSASGRRIYIFSEVSDGTQTA